jgi:hypothetical protein
MKKLHYFIISLLILTPLFVSADSYDGPYCFEDPKMNSEEYVGSSTIRGTCKQITITNTVLLDQSLSNDYYLGRHEAVGFDCFRGSCSSYSKYSEILTITNSTSLSSDYPKIRQLPKEYALFDRNFFNSKLSNISKEYKSTFSLASFETINVNLFQNESDFKNAENTGYWSEEKGQRKTDTLYNNGNYGDSTKEFKVFTFAYKEYGKHIFAPKGELTESQYTDFKVPNNLPQEKDLGISAVMVRGLVPIVKVTNPLISINNYWLYTKQDGKLTLSWQKTEYTLDDGSVKTITKDDKNVNVAMLFNKKAKEETVASSSTTTSTTTDPAQKSEKNQKHIKPVPSPLPVLEEISLFQKFINFLASLFN